MQKTQNKWLKVLNPNSRTKQKGIQPSAEMYAELKTLDKSTAEEIYSMIYQYILGAGNRQVRPDGCSDTAWQLFTKYIAGIRMW